jgi:ankyrin repeat protein
MTPPTDWVLDSLLQMFRTTAQSKIREILVSAIPPRISDEYLPSTMKALFRRRHQWTRKQPYIKMEDGGDFPAYILADDRERIPVVLLTWRAVDSPADVKEHVLHAFLMAVQSRRYSVLRELLLAPELDVLEPRVSVVFNRAVANSDEEIFHILHESGVPLSCLEHGSFAVAAMTCRSGFLGALKSLPLSRSPLSKTKHTVSVENNRSADQPNDTHLCQEGPWASMIHYSIVGENWPGFCLLLDGSGPEQLEAKLVKGFTPLHLSILRCQPLFAAALIAHGADTGPVAGELFIVPGSPTDVSLLHIACRHQVDLSAVEGLTRLESDEHCLFDLPAGDHRVDEPTLTCWKVMICVLLHAGLDINATDSHGMTPIRYLLRRGEHTQDMTDRVQFLHQHGARLDVAGDDGSYPIDSCYLTDNIPWEAQDFIITNTPRDIIDAGTTIGTPSPPTSEYARHHREDLESPLAAASFHGDRDLCRRLIRRGARLTFRSQVVFDTYHPYEIKGVTTGSLWSPPIPENLPPGTVSIDYMEMYTFPLIGTRSGSMDSDVAATMYSDCFNPHLNATDIVGRTRLHLAVQEGAMEAVMELLKHKAFLSRRDWLGFTPLHLAYAAEHDRIIEMLETAAAEGPVEISVGMRDRRSGSNRVESPLPSELRDIFKKAPDLWGRLSQAYQQEMERRAGLWPEKRFVAGADCLVQSDFMAVLGLRA